MAENGKLAFATSLNNEALIRSGEEAKGVFKDISKSASEEGSKIDSTFKNLGKAVAGYLSVTAAANFAKQIVRVRGEIENLEVSFKTLIGDEQKAVDLMSNIRKFAASTPMQMNDLAEGAQTLLAFNIEAEKVMPMLQALGDVSMGDTQKFQSLTLAFAQMSSTGKLMGQDLLQMINAGFNPLSVISEQTGKSIGELKDEMSKGAISSEMITQAFIDATSEGGKFYQMLEKQSKGIQGSLSNVQGAFTEMLNSIGESIQEPVVKGLHAIQSLIQHYEAVGKVIAVLISTYGSYKAAVMAYNAVMVVSTNITKGYTIAQQAEYVWLLLVEKAQALLNKTMLKNPYVLATAAVLSLVSALVMLRKRTSEAEMAQKSYEAAVNGQKEVEENRLTQINTAIQSITGETETVHERTEAYREFAKLFPELFKQYKETGELTDEMKKKIDELVADPKQLKIEVEKQGTKDLEDALKRYEDAQKKAQSLIGGNMDEFYSFLKTFEEEAEAVGMSVNTGANFDKFISFQIEATKKALDERKKLIEQDEWDAQPIEQRIEITKSSIEQVESEVENLKKQVEDNPWNPVVVLKLKTAEGQLNWLKKKLESLGKEKTEPVKVDFGGDVKKAEAALRKAREAYRKDATSANKAAVEAAKSNLDATKKNYEAAMGKDYDQSNKSWQDRRKQQKALDAAVKEEREEYAKWLVESAREAEFERREAEIDAMKEGIGKTLAQIELDYDQQIAAVSDREEEMIEKLRDLKEKEWEAANPTKKNNGEKFDRSTVTSADLTAEQQAQLTEATERALKERERKEKQSFDKQLQEVQTYQQKRLSIIEEYSRREEDLYNHDEKGNRTGLRSGVTDANVAENNRQRDEALRGIDEEFASRSAAYESWCNQISTWTYTQLLAALEAGKIALKQAESDFGKDSEETAKLRAQLVALENEIRQLKNQGEGTGSALSQKFSEISPSLERLASEFTNVGEQVEALGDAMGNDLTSAAGKTMKAVGSIAQSSLSIFKNILTLTQSTTSAIQTATTTATSAMAAAAEGAAGAIRVVETASVILAVIGAALGIAQAIVSLVKSANEKRHEEALKDIEEQIDAISESYDILDRQAQKTFGASNAEIRRQQIELKKAQIELLNTAIAEERAQKSPDNDKISQWQSQIDQISDEINNLRDSAEEAIYGEDISSAIENFADALTDAWAQGTNSAQAAKDQVKRMMREMVMESIKDAIQSGAQMARIREMLAEFYSDGVFSTEERSQLEQMAENLAEQIENQFGWAMDLFSESDREGSKKGIATASQESVDELNGRMTAIQSHTHAISEHTANISINSNIIRNTVEAILNSVSRIETNTEELHTIRSTINDIQTQGVRIRS